MNINRVPELLDSLSDFLPSYNKRPGQLEMANAVAGAITGRSNLVVEGGTGIGKSMAYLVPAILAVQEEGARVLIATSHKALQDQISRKDLPLLNNLFQKNGYRPFTFTTLKGIGNYLCWNSAEAEQGKLVLDQKAAEAIRYALTAWPDFSGDFEDFPFNISPETRSSISADSEDCLGTRCPHRDRCYALKVRKQAEEADVVVTNHALLTLDIKSEGNIIPGAYATYIIDEGHNFEENATRANGLQVTLGAIRRFINNEIVRRAAVASTQRLQNARDDLDKLQNELIAIYNLQSVENRFSDAEDDNRILLKRELSAGKVLVESLKELLTLVKSNTPRTEEEAARSQRVLKQGAALAERLERISANGDPNLVYYVERMLYERPAASARPEPVIKVNGRPIQQTNAVYSLYAMPIDVSGYLEKWFSENQVVVTSATLSDGQNFDFFTRRVGMHKPETLIVPSPFNYKEQVRLFLPKSGSAPAANGSYSQQLARQMIDLLNLAPGRALLLFTSHAMLEAVWRQATGPLAGQIQPVRPLFKQGQAQMQRIINDFKATENGVIFGTRSWWQGVDLPGMRLLVMDKLPFPQLNDPLVKARIEEIDHEGGSSFVQFMLPLAIITFRQGFGRLMRQENDWGVVVVCDERIVQKSYGRRFIKSLPEVPTLPNVEQLKEFFAVKA
ncbi:MAG TPA: helicase C-terminal domain-containing protein [Chloroflexia bacterium]|nr:helicase C-terminal domain-containing protein [Chloroflexia bacterium]